MNKIFTNVMWRLAENCSTQFVSFVVSIVLARILLPSDYAPISIVLVIINILTVFVNSSMATTLIQKKDIDNADYSTAFYFNLIVSIILYILVFTLAPLIAEFYSMEELTMIIRVMSLILIAAAIKNVQLAYASKLMQFRKFFYSSLFGTVFSAIVGIYMAYKGYGVWSLVSQQLIDGYIDAIFLWFTVKWRPTAKFSIKRFIDLYNFGSKMLMSTFIEKIYIDFSTLVVGKVYSPADLAFYNKGRHLPDIIIANINASIESVLLPAMSDVQDEKKLMKNITKKTIKMSTFIIFPLIGGIIAISHNFIELFYTSKWLPCVPYLCIFTLMFIAYPIKTTNLNSIKALGKGNTVLFLQIIEKAIGILLIMFAININPLAIALSCLLSSLISIIVYTLPNRKYIDYGLIEQIKDTLSQLLLSVIMCVAVYCLGTIKISILIKLILQVLVGVLIYFFGSKLLRIDSYEDVKDIIRHYVK